MLVKRDVQSANASRDEEKAENIEIAGDGSFRPVEADRKERNMGRNNGDHAQVKHSDVPCTILLPREPFEARAEWHRQ